MFSERPQVALQAALRGCHSRGAGHSCDPVIPVIDQVAGGLMSTLFIGMEHRGQLDPTDEAVQRDQRHLLSDYPVDAGVFGICRRGEQNSVDPVLDQQPKALFFTLGVLSRMGDNDGVAQRPRPLFHRSGYTDEEGAAHVGEDQAKCIGAAGAKAPSHGVGLVTQLLNGSQHLLAHRLGDKASAVQHMRNGGVRDRRGYCQHRMGKRSRTQAVRDCPPGPCGRHS